MTMGDANLDVAVGYLSAGANRQTGVADWNQDGTLAFGADSNICLWRPTVTTTRTCFKSIETHQN
jgi:elongator complex protein 2